MVDVVTPIVLKYFPIGRDLLNPTSGGAKAQAPGEFERAPPK